MTKQPRLGTGVDISAEALEEVKSEYKKSLVIPDTKLKPQFLLCPVGIVGAGKSTVVLPLADTLSMVRISGDEIRKVLQEKGFNWKKIRTIASELIEEYVVLGYRVAIDSDCAGPETRKKIQEIVDTYAIPAVWIHIHPPEEFIINKLRKYNHTWLYEDADQAIENYYARKSLHEHLDIPFSYTFDTSKNNLTTQISECVEIIEKTITTK